MKCGIALTVAWLALGALKAAAAEIVITETAVEPPVLRVQTGASVDFVNRTQRSVHVEFGVDPRGHDVVQLTPAGPTRAVFHRPGTHPFVVHVWQDRLPITLAGVVEVVADLPPRPAPKCGVTVGERCVER
jgi:plastocyanin